MKNIKKSAKWIPEFYLIASVLYYWMMTGNLLNPIAITLLALLTFLLVRKNKILGILIATVFLALNLFLILALISELNEFPIFDNDARILLLVGSAYLGLNIALSTIMLLKWGTQSFSYAK